MSSKTFLCLITLIGVLILQSVAFSQEDDSSAPIGKELITAEKYALFLNSVGTRDAEHFYDEKMGFSFADLIIRTGEVGNYYYEVVEGKEDVPLTFLSDSNATQYMTWCQDPLVNLVTTSTPINFDKDLLSNISSFYLIKPFAHEDDNKNHRSLTNLEILTLELATLGAIGAGIKKAADRPSPSYEHTQEHAFESAARRSSELERGHQELEERYTKLTNSFGREEHEKLTSWQNAHKAYSDAANKRVNEAFEEAKQRLEEIENGLSPQLHVATALYRTKTFLNSFRSHQNTINEHLGENAHGILIRTTTNITALVNMAERCCLVSEKKEVQDHPFIVEQYKTVGGLVSRALDEYATVIQKIETGSDVLIRGFLEQREEQEKKIAKKLEICYSLLDSYQELEGLSKVTPSQLVNIKGIFPKIFYLLNHIFCINTQEDLRVFEWIASEIDYCFKKAIETPSLEAQNDFQQAVQFYLQGAKERVTQFTSAEERILFEKAYLSQKIAEDKERLAAAATEEEKNAYKQAIHYEEKQPQKRELINKRLRFDREKKRGARRAAMSDPTLSNDAREEAKLLCFLDDRARREEEVFPRTLADEARKAGMFFKQDLSPVERAVWKNICERWFNWDRQAAEEVAKEGNTDQACKFKAAAEIAREKAGGNFKRMISATTKQEKAAYREACRYALQEAEEVAKEDNVDQALKFKVAAEMARKAAVNFCMMKSMEFQKIKEVINAFIQAGYFMLKAASTVTKDKKQPYFDFYYPDSEEDMEEVLAAKIASTAGEIYEGRAKKARSYGVEEVKEEHQDERVVLIKCRINYTMQLLAKILQIVAQENAKVRDAYNIAACGFNLISEAKTEKQKAIYYQAACYELSRLEKIIKIDFSNESWAKTLSSNAQNLALAAQIARKAGEYDEMAVAARSNKERVAYQQMAEYTLQRAEEVAHRGKTEVARRLYEAVNVLEEAVKDCQRACKARGQESSSYYNQAAQYGFEKASCMLTEYDHGGDKEKRELRRDLRQSTFQVKNSSLLHGDTFYKLIKILYLAIEMKRQVAEGLNRGDNLLTMTKVYHQNVQNLVGEINGYLGEFNVVVEPEQPFEMKELDGSGSVDLNNHKTQLTEINSIMDKKIEEFLKIIRESVH